MKLPLQIVMATRNPSKAERIREIFANSPNIQILTMEDVGIKGAGVEDGKSLQENATKKALYAKENLPANSTMWTMSEDTGLFITALDGQPGIYPARWVGEHATTAEITAHTLKAMSGKKKRGAMFETVVVIINPAGKYFSFIGRVEGKMLTAERVPPQPNMPYSGIFLPNGQALVWAEMSVEYENKISHRGKAFREARDFLEGYIGTLL